MPQHFVGTGLWMFVETNVKVDEGPNGGSSNKEDPKLVELKHVVNPELWVVYIKPL